MTSCRSLQSFLTAFLFAFPIVSTAKGLSGLSVESGGGAKTGGNEYDLVLNEEGGGEPDDLSFAAPGRYNIYEETVKDNFTGLEWQRGHPGVHHTLEDPEGYCLDLDWGGHTDWRLPDFLELHSIVSYEDNEPGTLNNSIDLVAFPDAYYGYYISSTKQRSSAGAQGTPILVDFARGEVHVEYTMHGSPFWRTRCVRGGTGLAPSFQINNDGTVTDKTRSILWERFIDWDNSDNDHCEDLVLAGRSNWRLPTVHELASLIDFRQQTWLMHTVVFPGYWFWDGEWLTSQPNKFSTGEVWQVRFHSWKGRYIEASVPVGTGHIARCVHDVD